MKRKQKNCPNTYKCANCGKVNHKGWSDEEAMKESEFFFGVPNSMHDPRFVVICDSCFQKMHPQKHPDKVASARIELGVDPPPSAP